MLVVALVALCLCATFAACDLLGDRGHQHEYKYAPYDEFKHVMYCTSGDSEKFEDHKWNGEQCSVCGYLKCQHPYFYAQQYDEEFHRMQCMDCDYNFLKKHSFGDGDFCLECNVPKMSLTRKIGDLYYVLNDDGTASVTAWYDTLQGYQIVPLSGTVTIPQTVTYDNKTYTVTSVAPNGFDQAGMSKVILPETLTEIGYNGFLNCLNLTEVYLPQNLLVVGDEAFGNSPNISHFYVPASVTVVGFGAFDTNGYPIVYCQAASQPYGFDEHWLGYFGRPVVVWNVKEACSNSQYDYGVLNDNTVAIARYKGEIPDMYLTLPAEIDSYPVTEIADRAYPIENYTFKYMEVPASVQKIGTIYFSAEVFYFDCDHANAPDIDVFGDLQDIEYLVSVGRAVFNSSTEAALIDGMRYALNMSNRTAQVSVNPSTVRGDIVIPSNVSYNNITYTVNGIKDNAFRSSFVYSGRASVTSLFLPATVISAGQNVITPDGEFPQAVTYFEGEINQDVVMALYGRELGYTADYAVYDNASGLWYSAHDGVAKVALQPNSVASVVTIPNSITVKGAQYDVTEIVDYAFSGRNLTEVTVSANVTVIGESAFSGCDVINVNIASGSNLQTIGEYAFGSCAQLESIQLENAQNLQVINRNAFFYCTALKKIHIPASVTEINEGFYGCTGLESVYITDLISWLSIKYDKQTVDFSANPLYYAHDLYLNNVLLTELTIPASLTEVSRMSMIGWSGTKVKIHKDVKIVWYNAFYGCQNLKTIEIEPGATGMQLTSEAFANCVSLYEVTIPAGSITMVQGVFVGCPYLVVYVQQRYDHNYFGSKWCDDPDGMVVYDSDNNDATKDGSLYVTQGNVRYLIKDGEATVILQYPNIKGNVTIANAITYSGKNTELHGSYNVTAIVKEAFANCVELTGVTIGANVAVLGEKAFYNCSGLATVTFASGSVLQHISANAFYGCTALKQITIPQSVLTLGASSFENCGLTTVTFAGGSLLTTIGQKAFDSCDLLKTILLPSSVNTIGASAFNGCSSLTQIAIPKSVTTISQEAFSNCLALASVTFDNETAITKIDASVFRASGITQIAIPKSVTEIGNAAFRDCIALKRVTFAENGALTTIGLSAFDGCAALADVTIPAYVTTIGNYAFFGCINLMTVTIVNQTAEAGQDQNQLATSQLTEIGNGAFENCTALVSINIPASVTSIGQNAFRYDLALTVYCQSAKGDDNVQTWNTNWRYVEYLKTLPVVWNASENNLDEQGNVQVYHQGVRYALKEGKATVVYQPKNVVKATICAQIEYDDVVYEVVGIAAEAFHTCKELTTVIFQTGQNFTYVGDFAFADCVSLTTCAIPSSVTSRGRNIFSGCDNLQQ